MATVIFDVVKTWGTGRTFEFKCGDAEQNWYSDNQIIAFSQVLSLVFDAMVIPKKELLRLKLYDRERNSDLVDADDRLEAAQARIMEKISALIRLSKNGGNVEGSASVFGTADVQDFIQLECDLETFNDRYRNGYRDNSTPSTAEALEMATKALSLLEPVSHAELATSH